MVYKFKDYESGSDGKIKITDLPWGNYYLEETKAPDGYIIAENPITIRLTLNNEYRDYKNPYTEITDISNTPYNWTQTINRLVYSNSKDGTGDEAKFIVEVLNNPGVELPASGGPGSKLIYSLGIIRTGIAVADLVMRKRRKAA